jgi:aminopeptidase N
MTQLSETNRTRLELGLITTLRGLSIVVVILLASTGAFAARQERAVSAWRPIHFNVAVTLDDKLSEITKARTAITLEVLKDKVTLIDLDFGEMAVDAVTIGGLPAKFDRASGLLNVHLANNARAGNRVVIIVDYHGRPKDGLVLAADKDGKPSATGDNWPNRVHHWIPCLDHPSAKATVTFNVTAPARDMVVANGKLDGVDNDAETVRTWTYSEGVPIPAYCMVIAVGEYARIVPTTSAITPLSYFVPQSAAKFAIQGFAPAAPSLKFFSETVAPYPYEKLALIVGATRFGGMENSSAIVFASSVFDPRTNPRLSRAFNIPEGLEQVVAHEIAHQWFGDSVTESTWADLWLSEGFATYFAGLFIQKHEGEDVFKAYMQRAAETYFTYAKTTRTPIHDTETEDLMNLLNANNYQKGSWVLHMLRSQLGDDAFFRGLRSYYLAHKESTASSDDLRTALEKASGKDLKAFFARWVYGTGHPRYEVSSFVVETPSAGLLLTLKQTQPEGVFPDPVPIEVTVGNETKRITIYPKSKLEKESLRFARGPVAIRVDPDDTLLKEVLPEEKPGR